jgi:hypothetical protein
MNPETASLVAKRCFRLNRPIVFQLKKNKMPCNAFLNVECIFQLWHGTPPTYIEQHHVFFSWCTNFNQPLLILGWKAHFMWRAKAHHMKIHVEFQKKFSKFPGQFKRFFTNKRGTRTIATAGSTPDNHWPNYPLSKQLTALMIKKVPQ